MAKSSKSAKSDRQKVIDDIRRKQKGAEKRQGMWIVGVCVVIALGIILIAGWKPMTESLRKASLSGKSLEEIGAGADVCKDRISRPAEGAQEHVATGTQIEYAESPPAFGKHWNEANVAPAPISQRFYTDANRPELESLVHNLEHGFNILWYDETIADNGGQLAQIQKIADLMDVSDTNGRMKFKAVPWTKKDGKAFPDGQHIAFTHWSGEGQGIWQYCSKVSGAALDKFMIDYPYSDSVEPDVF